jgi:hypothetical protein
MTKGSGKMADFARTDADARRTLDALTKPARDLMLRMTQDREMTLATVRRAKEALERRDAATALMFLDVALNDSEWRRERFNWPVEQAEGREG